MPAGSLADGYRELMLHRRPLAYWRLDETTGALALDSSGNGRQAEIVGAVGRGEDGLFADGSNAAMRLSDTTTYLRVRDTLSSIGFEAGEDGAGTVTLTFAGGGAIRLDVDAVNAELRDLSEPWRTQSKPEHKD